jgi:ribosomal protein S18 acetylase RimI-like enzyme
VDPRRRGRGTGRALLATALAGARARGAPAALEVISLNREAIALYTAGGWRQAGEVSYDWLPDGERSLLFVPPDD